MTNVTEMNFELNLPEDDSEWAKGVERLIEHASWFASKQNAILFSDWIEEQTDGLMFFSIVRDANGYGENEYHVRFDHYGYFSYSDAVLYADKIYHKSIEFDGNYLGWISEVQSS